MLQDHDLDRIEAAWRAQGAPTADSSAPGLTADELDAYEAELGYPLPAELRRWWGRHNGAVGGAWSPGSAVGTGTWYLMSLREALNERAERIAAGDPPEFPEDEQEWEGQWAPWWLPLVTAGNAWLFADLRAAADGDGSAPIHLWAHVPDTLFDVRAPSWGHVINAWADGIERGLLLYSAGTGRWEIPRLLPTELRRLA